MFFRSSGLDDIASPLPASSVQGVYGSAGQPGSDVHPWFCMTEVTGVTRATDSETLGSVVLQPNLDRPEALAGEPAEPLPFLGQGVAIFLGQGLERLDHERSLSAGSLRLPCPLHEAVDEEGTRDHAVPGGDRLAVFIRDNAGAVVVGEDQ